MPQQRVSKQSAPEQAEEKLFQWSARQTHEEKRKEGPQQTYARPSTSSDVQAVQDNIAKAVLGCARVAVVCNQGSGQRSWLCHQSVDGAGRQGRALHVVILEASTFMQLLRIEAGATQLIHNDARYTRPGIRSSHHGNGT
eukprot:2663181-Amphidinium_carterae.1